MLLQRNYSEILGLNIYCWKTRSQKAEFSVPTKLVSTDGKQYNTRILAKFVDTVARVRLLGNVNVWIDKKKCSGFIRFPSVWAYPLYRFRTRLRAREDVISTPQEPYKTWPPHKMDVVSWETPASLASSSRVLTGCADFCLTAPPDLIWFSFAFS